MSNSSIWPIDETLTEIKTLYQSESEVMTMRLYSVYPWILRLKAHHQTVYYGLSLEKAEVIPLCIGAVGVVGWASRRGRIKNEKEKRKCKNNESK